MAVPLLHAGIRSDSEGGVEDCTGIPRDRQCLSGTQGSEPQPVGCVSVSLLPVSLDVLHVEVGMFL